eukprot:1424213-Amphidinium_carterae.1
MTCEVCQELLHSEKWLPRLRPEQQVGHAKEHGASIWTRAEDIIFSNGNKKTCATSVQKTGASSESISHLPKQIVRSEPCCRVGLERERCSAMRRCHPETLPSGL